MCHHWCISPRVFCIYSTLSILVVNNWKRLVKPSVFEPRDCIMKDISNISITAHKDDLLNTVQSYKINVPVITFPMQQGLGITIQTTSFIISHHALLVIIQCHKEGCPLNAVQRAFIDPTAEIFHPGFGPWNSGWYLKQRFWYYIGDTQCTYIVYKWISRFTCPQQSVLQV